MKKVLLIIVIVITACIAHAQNVGIGTLTATEKLQVVGNIKGDTIKVNVLQLTPNAGAGKTLTSDANGNGTWQPNPGSVKALNGLNKSTDSIMLGGLLQSNTAIRLNANSLTITDTGSIASIAINQTNSPLAFGLSNVATTQSFVVLNNTNLLSVDIYIAALLGTSITLQLKDNTGTILVSVTNLYPSAFTGFSTFNCNNLILNAGQTYTIFLTSAANTQVYYDNNNPYTSGSSSISNTADIAFRINTVDEKNAWIIKAGKVGINTNNPTAALDINGTLKITDGSNGLGKVFTSDAAGKGSWQTITPATLGAWGINGNTGTSASNFIGTTDANDLIIKTGNVEKMRITNAGNLGIGTMSPKMPLHVVSIDSAVALFENTQTLNTNITNGLYFKTGNGPFPYTGAIKAIGESSSSARLGLFTFASPVSNQLAERLTIADAGNVGIGTITPDPSSILDLTSNRGLLLPRLTSAQKGSIPSPKFGLVIYQTDGISGIYAYTMSGWVHLISPGSADNGWLFNGADIYNSNLGNVGIGAAPNNLSKLTVLSNSGSYGLLHTDGVIQIGTYVNSTSGQFGTRTNHRLSFFTNNGAEDITLLPNGNVGINTITPQTQLHVNPAGAGSILLGTNKSSGGYTTLESGISAQTNGYGYIQTTRSSGSAYGNLLLSPYGGNVSVNYSFDANSGYPLDINESDTTFALRIHKSYGTAHNWSFFTSYTTSNLLFASNAISKASIASIDGAYTSASDRRYKKNINDLGSVLHKVMMLQAKTYEFIEENPIHKISTGFIAQDILPLFPDLVSELDPNKKNAGTGGPYYGLNYAGFGVIAIKAIQEQQEIIESQNKRIEKLEMQIELLLKKLN